MSWELLKRQLAIGLESEFDFVVDGDQIRNTGAVGGRERVTALRVRIDGLISGEMTVDGLAGELEEWHAELVDVIEELEQFEDRAAAETFQDAFGAIADALGALADSLAAVSDYSVLLGPLALLEGAVDDFDRTLEQQLAQEEPQPAGLDTDGYSA